MKPLTVRIYAMVKKIVRPPMTNHHHYQHTRLNKYAVITDDLSQDGGAALRNSEVCINEVDILRSRTQLSTKD
jgi:hypothetical protein